jgi:hypothetical protein
MIEFKFYIQRDGENEGVDILSHSDFKDSMVYSKCVGLLKKGKAKNKYIERFPETELINIWEGDKLARENTMIALTLAFKGENRTKTFDKFYDYVKKGNFYYWDNIRNKKAYLNLMEEVEPSDDIYKGNNPYIVATFNFTNLLGGTEDV